MEPLLKTLLHPDISGGFLTVLVGTPCIWDYLLLQLHKAIKITDDGKVDVSLKYHKER